jgi:hypothetical protein
VADLRCKYSYSEYFVFLLFYRTIILDNNLENTCAKGVQNSKLPGSGFGGLIDWFFFRQKADASELEVPVPAQQFHPGKLQIQSTYCTVLESMGLGCSNCILLVSFYCSATGTVIITDIYLVDCGGLKRIFPFPELLASPPEKEKKIEAISWSAKSSKQRTRLIEGSSRSPASYRQTPSTQKKHLAGTEIDSCIPFRSIRFFPKRCSGPPEGAVSRTTEGAVSRTVLLSYCFLLGLLATRVVVQAKLLLRLWNCR